MLARLAAAAVLVLVASASAALADGRVALVIGNSNLRPRRAAAERRERRHRHGGRAAAARVRGDDGAGYGLCRVERCAACVQPSEQRSRRVAGVLRGSRDGAGRREPPAPGGRTAGTRYRCALRDGDAGRRAGGDDGGDAPGGDPGCVPRQSARGFDRTDGGATVHRAYGAWEFRGVERGPAGEPDAGGVCGKGGDDGRGRAGSEQPVHGRRCWSTWSNR